MVVVAQQTLTDAQRALDESQFNDIRVLSVEQVGGDLMISGVVRSYYLKQQAQEAVRAQAGELVVVNKVVVRKNGA